MGTTQSKENDRPCSSLGSNSTTSSSSSNRIHLPPSIAPTFQPLFYASRTQCDAPPLPPPPAPLPSDGSSKEAPPPPPSPEEDDSIAQAAKSASAYSNPGFLEQVNQDSKRLVTLDTFDGFRCDISKQMSPFMVVIHNFWLGTSMMPDRKNSYAFVCQVADESGLFMARVDPERRSVDGRVHRALLGGLAMGKLTLGATAEGQADQALMELDVGAETWTANLKYGSMGGGTVYGCNYFQSITPRLALGGEGMYVAANNTAISNYTLKYTMPAKTGEEELLKSDSSSKPEDLSEGGSSTFWANFNTMQQALGLSYRRVVTPNRVTLGAQLECSLATLESQVQVAAEFRLMRSKMQFCIDGTGKIQSTLETKLGMTPGSPSLNFSAEVDHAQEDLKFGYGLNFEG